MSTSLTFECLCMEGCRILKAGAFANGMRAAVMHAARHHNATGHSTMARLTQETCYGQW